MVLYYYTFVFPLNHWVSDRQCVDELTISAGYLIAPHLPFDQLPIYVQALFTLYALNKDLELCCPIGKPQVTCHY